MHQSFSTHLIPIHSFRPKALCVGVEEEALLAFPSEMFQNGTQLMFLLCGTHILKRQNPGGYQFLFIYLLNGHIRLAILASR